jgi:hypothetical protein
MKYFSGQGIKGLGGKSLKVPDELFDGFKIICTELRSLAYGESFRNQNGIKTAPNMQLVSVTVPKCLEKSIKNIVAIFEKYVKVEK